MSMTKRSYLGRVAAKCANVLLDPLQSHKLVLETEVQDLLVVRLLALREAKRAKAVVEIDLLQSD